MNYKPSLNNTQLRYLMPQEVELAAVVHTYRRSSRALYIAVERL